MTSTESLRRKINKENQPVLRALSWYPPYLLGYTNWIDFILQVNSLWLSLAMQTKFILNPNFFYFSQFYVLTILML